MNRILITSALSIGLFASIGNADPTPGTVTLWIQPAGGGNSLHLIPWETARIQLWMNYSAPLDGEERLMVGMDAGLQEDPVSPVGDFEVIGFNDYGLWPISNTFFRFSRGQLDEAPHDGAPDITGVGNIDFYQFQGRVTPPFTNQTGLPPNLGDILLDEIIIRSVWLNDPPGSRVYFAGGAEAPSWFEQYFYEHDPSSSVEYAFNLGTGIDSSNPIYIHISGIPEPGSLVLVMAGAVGLIVLGRRREVIHGDR
ncbi:MAG TPA: PEP-CTERM sorting domain-containing protein [Phycisphaerae bacterium]|nr:PEP-CTERM sorting domain-containing protein [Phycisphaerae bacterium]